MSDTASQHDTPPVATGYGEADGEAASMAEAARKDEVRAGGDASKADRAAKDAAAKIPPDEAGPIGSGTSETDVKRGISDKAERKAAEASRAKNPK